MPKIIDIIQHKNKYSTQMFVVLNEKPVFKYERIGDVLIAEDSGFFNFFKYEKPDRNWVAFAGRTFDIPMVNGVVERAFGQWWDHFPYDYYNLLRGLGAETIEGLSKIHCFSSVKVDIQIVTDWLALNQPSNNYNKYNKRSQDYGVQTIISKF